MIDIHHHCLPAVDDGPRDWQEAVDMCALAASEGIETIVATPHVLRGRWRPVSRADLNGKLDELRARTDDTPHLVLGSEYFFAHDMPDVLQAGTPVIPLAGSRAVLVEFAANAVPPLVEQPFYRAQLDGWTLIIAHPERNHVFQTKPELLARLVRLGAKTQITAASITGGFGAEAEKSSLDWLRRGYVHLVATDAHSMAKRPPRIREARARVEEICGATIARALFIDNPKAILHDVSLAWEADVPYSTEPESLLRRMMRFFSK